MTVSLLAAAHVASRWLHMDVGLAESRAQYLAELDAFYVCNDDGWSLLVGRGLRVLVGEPGTQPAGLLSDFAAGWRTDYDRRRAA